MSDITQNVVKTKIPARMDRLPWSRWHTLVILSLGFVWVLDGLEVTIKGAVGASLKESIGFSTIQVAGSASVYLMGAITGALFWAYLTDRYGRKRLFIATLIVYLIGVGGTSVAGLSWTDWVFAWTGDGTYWWFAVFRFITGFGIGGEYAAIHSAVDEIVPARVRGWVDLSIAGSYWLGALFAALLGPFYLDVLIGIENGWRAAFATGALVAFGLLLMRLYVPESPRWLITHGYTEEAERVVDEIEEKVMDYEDLDELPEPPEEDALELRQRKSIGFREIAKTTFVVYPKRAIAGFGIMITQAFLYNAIFFTYGLMLTTFYDVSPATVGFFLIPFAVGNFFGPIILGRYFDKLGRRVMIPGTFWLAGGLTILTGFAFWQELFGSAAVLTIAWVVIFFFASAAASSGYLTVSETFPLEIRAMAIAFFYAMATAAGGIVGPILFGNLITGGRTSVFYGYLVAGVLMIIGGTLHRLFGVEAAQKGLEDIAAPLTAEEADEEGEGEGPDALAGPAGLDVTDEGSVRAFQREHGLQEDGIVGPETAGALRAADRGEGSGDDDTDSEVTPRDVLTVVDPSDPDSVRTFQERHGLEADGRIGPETRGAIRAAERRTVVDPTSAESIRAFQRAHSLNEDGVLGPRTQAALRAVHAHRTGGEEEGAYLMDVDVLDPESIKTFQRVAGLDDDGVFGSETRGALKLERARKLMHGKVDVTDAESVAAFQREHGLEDDGVIGPRTQLALRRIDDEVRAEHRRRRLFGVDPLDAETVARFQREHGLRADGCIGPETRRVLRRQRHLLLAIDPTDADSIRHFQEEQGLTADGVIGPQTQGAMRAVRAEASPTGIEEEDSDEREAADEEELERTLVLFDPADADQVRRFQERHGLTVDGIIGPRTQAALAAVVRERQLELADSELPRPERKVRQHRAGRAFVAVGGLGASLHIAGEDKDFDRELGELLDALKPGDTKSRGELREATHARRWGPGRFRYVLATAEEEGLVRKLGRDRYVRGDA